MFDGANEYNTSKNAGPATAIVPQLNQILLTPKFSPANSVANGQSHHQHNPQNTAKLFFFISRFAYFFTAQPPGRGFWAAVKPGVFAKAAGSFCSVLRAEAFYAQRRKDTPLISRFHIFSRHNRPGAAFGQQ